MTTTLTETQTPTDELRAASKTLRCKHCFPLQPPHGSLARPGDCTKCCVPYDHSEPVTDDARVLSAKLADLFDYMADDMEDDGAVEVEIRHDDGRRRKYVHPTATRPDQAPNLAWTAALKLARDIHGAAA
jgi:hypothetical protein